MLQEFALRGPEEEDDRETTLRTPKRIVRGRGRASATTSAIS